MKLLILNGTRRTEEELAAWLGERGMEAGKDVREYVDVRRYALKCCLGCDACQFVSPGICAIGDGLNELLIKFLSCDVAVLAAPVRFGCFTQDMKNFMDRTEPLFLPWQIARGDVTAMRPRHGKYPALVFAGELPEENQAEEFDAFQSIMAGSNLALACGKARIEALDIKEHAS